MTIHTTSMTTAIRVAVPGTGMRMPGGWSGQSRGVNGLSPLIGGTTLTLMKTLAGVRAPFALAAPIHQGSPPA